MSILRIGYYSALGYKILLPRTLTNPIKPNLAHYMPLKLACMGRGGIMN